MQDTQSSFRTVCVYLSSRLLGTVCVPFRVACSGIYTDMLFLFSLANCDHAELNQHATDYCVCTPRGSTLRPGLEILT